MFRRRSHWRLPVALAIVACLGVLAAVGAVYASDRWGGSSDAAGAAIPTLVKPVTHAVLRTVKVHVPPRIVHRHGKRIVIPGHVVTTWRLVTGPPVTLAGPTQTVTGPGGTVTVVRTVPGPTTTLPGGTTTLPGGTTTVPGPTTTVTEPGTTVTEPGTTVTVTVTEPPPPSS